jgi:hypothetical protein
MKRKALALIIVLMFVFTCIFCIPLVRTVESQSFETIYIRADGSVEGTDLIKRHENTYTFLNNISGSIVISKDFITIDGSGYALIGTDVSSQRGISLSDRKNVTVTDMVIIDYFIGISCGGTASNITILNNYVGSCGIGIEFLGSSNHIVKFNTFKNNDIDITINYVTGNNLITITYNNLNDYVQVWMSGQQTIDMNYWVDYNGTDSDGDGIGDSPYYYHEILTDSHPLMEPASEIAELPTPSPEPTATLEPTPTPSPEPTLTPPNRGPTSPPSQENLLTQEQTVIVILGAAVTVAVIVAGLGLLVYLIKRK